MAKNRDEHDLDQGVRDALALLTANAADDHDARQAVSRTKCCSCTTEALLMLCLTNIDEDHGGDVAGYAMRVTTALGL